MKRVRIDCEQVHSEDDFHDIVSREFSFPHYYGRNPNAFWDCLTEVFDETRVHVSGYASLQQELKSMISQYLDMMKEYEERRKGQFSVQIE